jgi:hypothetical protein
LVPVRAWIGIAMCEYAFWRHLTRAFEHRVGFRSRSRRPEIQEFQKVSAKRVTIPALHRLPLAFRHERPSEDGVTMEPMRSPQRRTGVAQLLGEGGPLSASSFRAAVRHSRIARNDASWPAQGFFRGRAGPMTSGLPTNGGLQPSRGFPKSLNRAILALCFPAASCQREPIAAPRCGRDSGGKS